MKRPTIYCFIFLLIAACDKSEEAKPLPSAGSESVTNITAYRATLNAKVTVQGETSVIEEAGFIYSESEIVTESDGIKIKAVDNVQVSEFPEDFQVRISGLKKNTTYFVRTYLSHNGAILLGSASTTFTTANTNTWTLVTNAVSASTVKPSGLGFSANSKLYFIDDFDIVNDKIVPPVYEFDPETKSLIQLPDFPGAPRFGLNVIFFTLGQSLYLGMGRYADNTVNTTRNDLWSYNLAEKSWEQVGTGPSFISNAGTLVIGNDVYVGAQTRVENSDRYVIWKYNATNSTWSETPVPLEGYRSIRAAFVAGEKGYFIEGLGLPFRVWEFDPQAANPWTQKKDVVLPIDLAISGAGVGSYGYVFLPFGGQVHKYDPSSDTWSQFSGIPPVGAISDSFYGAIDDVLYYCMGNDMYMYIPE